MRYCKIVCTFKSVVLLKLCSGLYKGLLNLAHRYCITSFEEVLVNRYRWLTIVTRLLIYILLQLFMWGRYMQLGLTRTQVYHLPGHLPSEESMTHLHNFLYKCGIQTVIVSCWKYGQQDMLNTRQAPINSQSLKLKRHSSHLKSADRTYNIHHAFLSSCDICNSVRKEHSKI